MHLMNSFALYKLAIAINKGFVSSAVCEHGKTDMKHAYLAEDILDIAYINTDFPVYSPFSIIYMLTIHSLILIYFIVLKVTCVSRL